MQTHQSFQCRHTQNTEVGGGSDSKLKPLAPLGSCYVGLRHDFTHIVKAL